MLAALKKEIRKHANKKRTVVNGTFFKTGKGEYGEGNKFLGLTMPQQRAIAGKYQELGLADVKKLLVSKWHEERMVGLLILVHKYEAGDGKKKKRIYDFYIKHRKAINNWDLVDVTTPKIVGDYLLNRDKKILYRYAKSKDLWERRIAILATFPFIKAGKLSDTLKISKLLLDDTEDLIHKAVGWMLREVGKQDQRVLEQFLIKHIRKLPRTTLRYAIERFPEKKRKQYLRK